MRRKALDFGTPILLNKSTIHLACKSFLTYFETRLGLVEGSIQEFP